MKIQKQDLFHGPALMQIVEHPSFKALNRASKLYGHYLINTDREVFTKFRDLEAPPWAFTFAPTELSAIRHAGHGEVEVFVCLVCGHQTICALSFQEFSDLVDMRSRGQQWIRVDVPRGGSCHVSGSAGTLDRVVPHSAFPEKLFSSARLVVAPKEQPVRNAAEKTPRASRRDNGHAIRFTLPFDKETRNMFRWQGDVERRRLAVYVPKWRLANEAPKRVNVQIEPERSARLPQTPKRSGGISVLMHLVKRFHTRVKYSPREAEPEIGDLFLPEQMSFELAPRLRIRIDWRCESANSGNRVRGKWPDEMPE